ncbi:hypothetical protein [Roseibium sp. MMSF_3544]|uniref:hypothetical protein n=1 Tax=unclassified Roseibium TaxID=2629323 RepID=UPI00273F05F0|nr:hypothetical protein [Roseibium sp. MMSF_3544]
MRPGRGQRGGTRFRLYTHPPLDGKPGRLVTVRVSSPVGSLGPGPSDHRMYAINPIGKEMPYGLIPGPIGDTLYLPPWDGPVVPPPSPGPDGHFDHIAPDDPAFEAVHLFGAVRFTLDVWESYLGEEIPWHFQTDYERLELSMIETWANAHMGYGYLETGARADQTGQLIPYALNFDIIAHEIGHAILVAMTGPFVPGTVPEAFEAFHEMSSDWVALIASLHFDSVIDELLENTSGNLDTFNRFSRFGEVSSSAQIRLANNNRTLDEFTDGWENEHQLAQPLIGAFFDIFVDVYHEILLDMGAVPPALEELADRAERDAGLRPHVQRGFDRAYERAPDAFREALIEVRDLSAEYLIGIWERIEKETFNFEDVRRIAISIDREQTGGRLLRLLDNSFGFRRIGQSRVGRRLRPPDENSHAYSARMLVPVPAD